MSRSRKKSGKRSKAPIGGSPVSLSLRSARDLLDSGKHQEGLARLNQLAAANRHPVHRGRIALLIAASESRLSRHREAGVAFGRAAALGRQAGDPDLVLQGGIGEVRSLLRSLRTEEAKVAADQLIGELAVSQAAFDRIAALSPADLAARGVIEVPARPPRPTVALTRIANAFIESGHTGEARGYLEKAVLVSPNGACRARQALARLALAADEPALAERYSREALQMGRFQAKTIAAWQLYLDARARQGLAPILEPSLFQSLSAHAAHRIHSASCLSIVRVLRGHGDPTWKEVAASVLAARDRADPIIATEIEKILHAEAKLSLLASPSVLAEKALRLFQAENVSPSEQISHGKDYVQYTLEAGGMPDVATLLGTAERFESRHVAALRHALALGAMKACRYDVARVWLADLINDLASGSASWGKATWALARMESMLPDRTSEAAAGYLRIAAHEDTPPRFRIQAMLRGLKFLSMAGGSADVPEIAASVRSILAAVDDYRVALDAARQLSLAGRDFSTLKLEAGARGEFLVRQAIALAQTPREALAIHEYAARKQYWDLRDSAVILSRWDALTRQQKSEFRSIGGSVWYQYCSLIFLSLVMAGRADDGVSLVSSVMNGDESTPEGYVIVGSVYALWLRKQGKTTAAFECFDWIATEAPTHRQAAAAHYWQAVRSLKAGDGQAARSSALAVRKCFAGCPALYSEWELDAKAVCILAGLSVDAAFERGAAVYLKEFLGRMIASIGNDLKSI